MPGPQSASPQSENEAFEELPLWVEDRAEQLAVREASTKDPREQRLSGQFADSAGSLEMAEGHELPSRVRALAIPSLRAGLRSLASGACSGSLQLAAHRA